MKEGFVGTGPCACPMPPIRAATGGRPYCPMSPCLSADLVGRTYMSDILCGPPGSRMWVAYMRPLHPSLPSNHSPVEDSCCPTREEFTPPLRVGLSSSGRPTTRQGRSPQASWWGDKPQVKISPHRIGLRTNRSASSSGFPLGKPDPQGGSEIQKHRKITTSPLSRGGRGGLAFRHGGREDRSRPVGQPRGGVVTTKPTHFVRGPNTQKRDRPPSRLPHRRERGAVPFSMLPFKSDCRIRRSGVAHCSRSRLEDSNS